jgi:hypothetical protein
MLNVTGLSNAPFSDTVSTIAARISQFYITYQEIEDATEAMDEAAALEGQISQLELAEISNIVDEHEKARDKGCIRHEKSFRNFSRPVQQSKRWEQGQERQRKVFGQSQRPRHASVRPH